MATAITLAAATETAVMAGVSRDGDTGHSLHKENALKHWTKIEGEISGKQVGKSPK